MERWRVLFITPYVPSPIRVRSYNLSQALVARGHRVHVLALASSAEEAGEAERLRARGVDVTTVPLPRRQSLANCARAVFTGWPLQAAFTRSPAMWRTVEQALVGGHYTLVHVEHLRGAGYGPACGNVPAVWDAVDCISLLLERTLAHGPGLKYRLAAAMDLARTRAYEAAAQGWYWRVLTTSHEDAEALRRLAPAGGGPVVALGHGVDTTYFSPWDLPRDGFTVVFTGKMSYHANVASALDLAHGVMPIVWQRHPEARLRIVGKDPPPAVQRLAEDPRIQVTGTVPDLRPHLAQATVAVCPLRYGVGIQAKALEAMAMATPVVASPQVARALGARVGQALLTGEGAAGLAQGIQTVLERPGLAAALGYQGRRHVEAHHDWRILAARLEAIYGEVIGEWMERPARQRSRARLQPELRAWAGG